MPRKTATPTVPSSPQHDGRPIVGQKIEIRKTGGAFSEDLLVANPELLDGVKIGSEITIALRVACIDEHYPAEDRKDPAEGGVEHKLVFDPVEVTVVDPAAVEGFFATHRERVARAKEDAEQLAGQQRLPTGDELVAAHDAGEHSAGLVDGCASCDEERDLAAAGK